MLLRIVKHSFFSIPQFHVPMSFVVFCQVEIPIGKSDYMALQRFCFLNACLLKLSL